MKTTVQSKINELQSYTLKEWNLNVQVTVDYKVDSVRILGTYSAFYRLISLNEKLLNEFGSVYINEIVVHEFAHAVVDFMFPTGYNGRRKVQSHGKEFRAICSHFGISGKATSNLFNDSKTIKKTNTRTFTYGCGCNETLQLSKIRHNKVLRGTEYRCSICHKKLVHIK